MRERSRRHAPEEARREILDSATRFLRNGHFRELTVGGVMALIQSMALVCRLDGASYCGQYAVHAIDCL